MDLASDPATEITDQNHIGGIAFVKELAQKADISKASRVLDLGSGLGGSARILSSWLGCRVHCIDLSPERCGDARRLTRLVGLDHLVTTECGDIAKADASARKYDVIWGQSAWVHVRDKDAFVARWSRSLRPGGRFALEEAYVKRLPTSAIQRSNLRRLSEIWESYLVGLDTWSRILSRAPLQICLTEDLGSHLVKLYRRLVRLARSGALRYVARSEQVAWRLADQLTQQGILGYVRIVARKSARR